MLFSALKRTRNLQVRRSAGASEFHFLSAVSVSEFVVSRRRNRLYYASVPILSYFLASR